MESTSPNNDSVIRQRREPGPTVQAFFSRRSAEISLIETLEFDESDWPDDIRCEGPVPLLFYWEIRDRSGNLLFRGTGADPTGFSAQVFVPDPTHGEGRMESDGAKSDGSTFKHQLPRRESTIFWLVLPKLVGAERLLIYSTAGSRFINQSLSQPLATFEYPLEPHRDKSQNASG
jgi:hypothetical protein